MADPTPPRNRDQSIPTKSGEDLGEPEPLTPKPDGNQKGRNAPLPEEETYERDRYGQSRGETPIVEH